MFGCIFGTFWSFLTNFGEIFIRRFSNFPREERHHTWENIRIPLIPHWFVYEISTVLWPIFSVEVAMFDILIASQGSLSWILLWRPLQRATWWLKYFLSTTWNLDQYTADPFIFDVKMKLTNINISSWVDIFKHM